MQNAVLIEKRKNLLASNNKSSEIFLVNNFIDLNLFFNEDELYQFLNDKSYNTTLEINKIKIISGIKETFQAVTSIEELKPLLIKWHFEKISVVEEIKTDFEQYKKTLIKKLIDVRVKDFDFLIKL